MGAILAKFRRQASTRDILEKIQKDLNDIEEFKQSTQAHHKKLIGYLLTYFSALYFIAAVFVYFKYFYHPEWQDLKSQLQLLLPFIIAPLLFMIMKNVLTWWYHRKIRLNEAKADKLKKQKETLLEKVMETETYKVAKEILEKFGVEHPANRINAGQNSPGLNNSNRVAGTPGLNRPAQQGPPDLRRRHTAQTPAVPQNRPTGALMVQKPPAANSSFAVGANEATANASFLKSENSPALGQRPQPGPLQRRAPGPPLPRPVLPRERGYMDRMVEYLVGDGPSNRYALICKQCQSHNGMALKEEFEYIAYRCCYCFYWNPARKQRPVAPRLEKTLQKQSSTESTSDDEEESVAAAIPPSATEEVGSKSESVKAKIDFESQEEQSQTEAESEMEVSEIAEEGSGEVEEKTETEKKDE